MTRDEALFQLMQTYMVRNIGWSPATCLDKAREALLVAQTTLPTLLPNDELIPQKVVSPPTPPIRNDVVVQSQAHVKEPRNVRGRRRDA